MSEGKGEKVFNVVLAISAIAIAGSLVVRTFFPSLFVSVPPVAIYQEDWDEALSIGWVLHGDSSAPVTLIELTDLECPACRGFQSTLEKTIAKFPEQIRLIYVSYPLEYHEHALPAARAAECAARAGRIADWVKAVYAKQDSLGTKSWSSFASDAGITDTLGIQVCAEGTGDIRNIAAGQAYGVRVGLTGTPQLLINGWRYASVPSALQLDSAVTSILEGKRPY